MLSHRSQVLEDFVRVGQVEVAADAEVLRLPVVPPEKRMHVRDPAPACRGIPQVAHIELSCIVFVVLHLAEYLRDRTAPQCPFPEHVLFPGSGIHLYAGKAGAFLPAVVLLLHQEIELVQTVHRGTILFPVVLQRLKKPDHGNATFVFQRFHKEINTLLTVQFCNSNSCESHPPLITEERLVKASLSVFINSGMSFYSSLRARAGTARKMLRTSLLRF